MANASCNPIAGFSFVQLWFYWWHCTPFSKSMSCSTIKTLQFRRPRLSNTFPRTTSIVAKMAGTLHLVSQHMIVTQTRLHSMKRMALWMPISKFGEKKRQMEKPICPLSLQKLKRLNAEKTKSIGKERKMTMVISLSFSNRQMKIWEMQNASMTSCNACSKLQRSPVIITPPQGCLLSSRLPCAAIETIASQRKRSNHGWRASFSSWWRTQSPSTDKLLKIVASKKSHVLFGTWLVHSYVLTMWRKLRSHS